MARDAEKQVSATAASHYVTLGLKKNKTRILRKTYIKMDYGLEIFLNWCSWPGYFLCYNKLPFF